MYSLMSALPRYRAHPAGSTSTSTSPSAQQRSLSPSPASSTDASPDTSTPSSPCSSPHSSSSTPTDHSTPPLTVTAAAQPTSVLLTFSTASADRDPPVVVYDHLHFTVADRPLLFRSLHRSDLLELRRLQEHLFPVRYSDEFYCSLLQPQIVSLLAFLPPPPPDTAADDDLAAGVSSTTTAASLDALRSEASAAQSAPTLVCIALVSYPPPPPPRPCSTNSAIHSPAYLITLGVSEPYRQLGLGSLLLSCLPSLPGLHTVREWRLHVLEGNEAAVRLYVRGGWMVRERLMGHYHIDGKLHNALEMSKEEDADSTGQDGYDCDEGSGDERRGGDGGTDDEEGKGKVSKRRRTKWVCVRRNWTPGGCAIQ